MINATHRNELGQPVGFPMPHWKAPSPPPRTVLAGRYCRLEPIDPARHTADLCAANALDADGAGWTYLTYGPLVTLDDYRDWIRKFCMGDDPLFYAIVNLPQQKAVGVASFMRIDPKNGAIEVGGIKYSPLLQRTRAATEAMHLMMARAFDLGYRRYEWKCDSFNAPSRAAAQRYGFSYEGIFRHATVYKNRSRDTAWYSIVDSEWPALNDAFTRWLAPENFDAEGRQRISLSALTGPLLKARG
ncbi:MAG TPA: GNAT family protein [Burkholderiales bacterium]|nr:GNAT family protein [Burkholderiales bacterium]